jgi:hypothetical protein
MRLLVEKLESSRGMSKTKEEKVMLMGELLVPPNAVRTAWASKRQQLNVKALNHKLQSQEVEKARRKKARSKKRQQQREAAGAGVPAAEELG